MKLLEKLYRAIGTRKVISISFILVILVLISFSVFSLQTPKNYDRTSLGFNILRLEIVFSKSEFINVLNAMGEEGVKAYKKILITDSLFPVIYACFIGSIISALTKKFNFKKEISYIFWAMIFLGGILDYIENIFHFNFLYKPETISDISVCLSSVISIIKWSFAFTSVFYIIYLLTKIALNNFNSELQSLE